MTVVVRLLLRRPAALVRMLRDRKGGARLAVAGCFVLLFGLVMVGEYEMCRWGLMEVLSIGPPSTALILYMLEAFLVLVLVIAILSFAATGLWTFYRAPDTAFLLSTPLPRGRLLWLRALETFLLTSWAFVILAVPAFLALGVAHAVAPVFYLWALAILLLLMTLAGGLGTLLTVLAGAALTRSRGRTATTLGALIVVGALALLAGRSVMPSARDFYLIFEPGIPNGKPASIRFIEKRFEYWPSHPLAVSLFAGLRHTTAGSSTGLVMATWGGPALAVVMAWALGRRLFDRALPLVAEKIGPPARRAARGAGGVAFPRRLGGPVGALVERDLVTLRRTPQELGHAAFLIFLLVLYTAVLAGAPLAGVGDRPERLGRLLFLDLLAAGYFVTAFGIRFVFPSFSLEGRGAWVALTSPLPLGRLLAAKLLTYSALLFVAVGPIVMGGVLRLVTAPALLGALGLLLALTIVTTVTVCLAFGALWPDFRELNAERLATSGGGLAAIVLCLGYVAVIGWLGRTAVLAFSAGASVLPSLVAALACSAAVVIAAAWAVARRLRTLEILS